MSVAFFGLVLIFFCLDQTGSTGTVYYIASTTDACGNTNGINCQTLSQFAANHQSASASNTTLILLEGNHHLNRNLYISYVDEFTIHPNSSIAVINCGGSWHIQILSTQTISIRNVSFVGCRMSVTYTIGGLILSNSQFEGQSITGTALVLENVAHAEVYSCMFKSNKIGTNTGQTLPPYNGIQSTVGGAIFSTHSNINISQSKFEDNSAGYGGAIFTQQQSSTIVVNSIFINNTARAAGSALYDYQGTVDIHTSIFSLNMALGLRGSGGALYFYETMARIKSCSFINNSATYGGVQRGLRSTIHYDNSSFSFNSAVSWGGVMDNQRGSNITIRSCHFERNSVNVNQGGVVRTNLDIVIIINSTFLFNTAKDSSGGALSGLDSNFTIVSCRFIGNFASNRGGALYTIGSKTMLHIFDSPGFISGGGEKNKQGTVFINNSADHGGAVYSTARSLIINGSIFSSNNSAGDSYVFYIALTTGQISGILMFSNNLGSLALYSSDIVLDASGEFINNTNSGAISILQSTIYLNGSFYRLEHNYGENGGAIYAIESKLYISAPVRIENNRALENGGGIYLYQSEIDCGQNCHLIFESNQATKRGGGIHAISSLIELNALRLSAQSKWIEFNENSAEEGGGLLLESNAKLYIIQYDSDFYQDRLSDFSIVFQSNSANYGGAVYIDDYTNSVGACSSTSQSPTSECFFQVLSRYIAYGSELYTTHMGFFGNHAMKSGPILYGGLLDRCTRSPFAEIINKFGDIPINGVSYFEDASSINNRDLASISSGPVQVCPCINGQRNCSYTPHINVKKGQIFTVSLTVIDQVGHPVNATVSGYLHSTKSELIQGQLNFITKTCERINLRALSPHNSEQLTLYASDGPCRDAPHSSTNVNIQFIPCNQCPIGFQPVEISCDCYCNDDIKDYVSCNSTSELLVRKFDIWIAYINQTSIAGYLIYLHCPFGYCYEGGVPVNLNEPNGEDAQCRFNRSGLLCGSCQPGLSLSLGSSQCLSCPSYWPALFLSITIAAIIAGIVLVILLLALNLTVAVGTLNGLIFYANIVAVNRSILLPFAKSNFITIFISWLNLELGIETCYFTGMDAYTKTWLQLVFPTYVILLVFLIIIISHHSLRFSDIIGRRNPVATLATLLLLSYAKILQTGITALSYATIVYPDGHKAVVWRPDATVNYLTGKHIILLVAGVVILLGSLVYTVLILCCHWLQFCSRWKILSWVTNPKFRTFIEVYTVPYASTHRYWTGLLLLLRIILYLITALNFSGNPTIVLASVVFTIGLILFLKSLIGRVYTNWGVDFLETLFFLNILSFALFTWLALNAHLNQRAVAYVSVITSFILLLMIVLYHIHLHTKIFSKLLKHKYLLMIADLELFRANVMPKDRMQYPTDDLCPLQEPLLDALDDSIINTRDPKRKGRPSELAYSEAQAQARAPVEIADA